VSFFAFLAGTSRSSAGKELSRPCKKNTDWTESLFEIIYGSPLLFQSSRGALLKHKRGSVFLGMTHYSKNKMI
jgi:hypothetical protein